MDISRYNHVLFIAVALAIGLGGCSNDREKTNDENIFYDHGVTYRQEQRYAEAVEAFRLCLRYSPESYEAHRQLAILYKDHFKDLPRAIVHYKAYIENAPESIDSDVVETWLAEAEREFYLQLRNKYEADDAALAAADAGAEPETEAETPETTPQTDTPEAAAEIPEPAAAETPVVAEEPVAEAAPSAVYVVREGDNLSKIARSQYGAEKHWTIIFEANRDTLASEDELHVGQRLKMPGRPE